MKCVAVDRSLTLVFVVALGLMGLFATGFAQQTGSHGAGAQGTGQSSRPATTQPHATQPSEPPAYDKVAYALISTNKGDILLELDHEAAPISVENFLAYVNKKFYDGTVFHRVKPGFMIQGGGFTPQGQQKPTEKGILNEWQNGLKNTRGTIAMARIGGNPSSGTSQFFINLVDNSFLDQAQQDGAGYAVFGKVISGMNVVDTIAKAPTGNRANMADWPLEDVVIKAVRAASADEVRKIMTPATTHPSTMPATTKPATTAPAAPGTTKPH